MLEKLNNLFKRKKSTKEEIPVTNSIHAFKVINADWKSNDILYEVGKTYDFYDDLVLGSKGFHACENLDQCFLYCNNILEEKHICEVEILGDIIENQHNIVTNKIRILRELSIEDAYEYLRVHHNFINWSYISKNMILSDDFIREFFCVLDWKLLSQYQNLSDNIISEFKYKIDWALASKYQNLSKNTLIKFKNDINKDQLKCNAKIPAALREEFCA